MGENVDRETRSGESIRHFTQQLLNDIKALEIMLEQDMIESGVDRIGAEQELCLVDGDWHPAPMAMEVLASIDDPLIVNEYARFNLEINLSPQDFKGDCLARMERQLKQKLAIVETAAAQFGARYVLVGILPTLRQRDLTPENMAPLDRYRTLDENLKRLRGGRPFRLSINGADELITQHESSLLESCNTSFQVHLQVSPQNYVDQYNFSQLISAPLLAAATNATLLFGKRLWHETRIALFQQSIDTRGQVYSVREQSPRVSFGNDWLARCVTEIFKDNLARFRFIMHAKVEENALDLLAAGKIPKLRALCLFNGTTYPWNRPCYGISGGKPHLRIENRVLPSGPTVVDEIANAAFWLGMMKGMPDDYLHLGRRVNFHDAQYNFFKAAKMGLDSQFVWLDEKVYGAADLIQQELLPMAREGLKRAEVDSDDIDRYLGLVEERVVRRHTGSLWLFESFSKLLKEGTRFEAAVSLTASMARHQKEGKPITEWPLADAGEARAWRRKYGLIDQIMSTDIYTVGEDDSLHLAIHIMEWKRIRHIPVENENNQLVGIIDAGMVLKALARHDGNISELPVSEVMSRDPIKISPDTTTLRALELMSHRRDSCLLVVERDRLVGVVTEYDFTKIAASLLRGLENC